VPLVYIASAKPATVREKIKENKVLFFPEWVVNIYFEYLSCCEENKVLFFPDQPTHPA
jgi:hypothetical protein